MTEIIIQHSLKMQEGLLVKRLLATNHTTRNPIYNIVVDDNTYIALGKRVQSSLETIAHTRINIINLGKKPSADMKYMDMLISRISNSTPPSDSRQVLIAIGSGTINDLTKYAAATLNIPYIVFATAPSMNGYISTNASISRNGYKETLKAVAPAAVICDLEILSSAPKRLILSGFGDAMCRHTAQADWLLSHMLMNTKYDETLFNPIKKYENKLLKKTDKLIAEGKPKKENIEAAELLMRNLLESGKAMTLAGGSYPASQAEHMIAHCYNMLANHNNIECNSLHGEEIAITTLYVTKQYETLIKAMRQPSFRCILGKKFPLQDIEHTLGKEIAEKFHNEYAKKLYSPNAQEAVANAQNTLSKNRKNIAHKLENILIPYAKLHDIMKKLGVKTNPESIGWDKKLYDKAKSIAEYSRNRFTILDMLPLSDNSKN